MARISLSVLHKSTSRLSAKEKRARNELHAVLATVLAAATVVTNAPPPKTPVRTSILTGQRWLAEILDSPTRINESLGMSRAVFKKLCKELQREHGLKDSKFVSADEQLAIFLYFARHGASSRVLQERFQRSGETISRYIKKVTKIMVGSFYRKYVKPLPDCTPPEIADNPKFFPYFADARGAIDGSHFNSWVREEATVRYRNRKGFISQNVLAICDWKLRFLYILSGWEGSAADSRVFEYARERDLALPAGKYFLADAGFPQCDLLMTPYRGVRYHLNEWGRGNQKPQNAQELYNLRHASARNVIERIFGVFKRAFSVTQVAPEYPIGTQAMFIPVLAAIHNYISIHDKSKQNTALQPSSSFRSQASEEAENEVEIQNVAPEVLGLHISAQESRNSAARRDRIAQQMWVDYQAELQKRAQN